MPHFCVLCVCDCVSVSAPVVLLCVCGCVCMSCVCMSCVCGCLGMRACCGADVCLLQPADPFHGAIKRIQARDDVVRRHVDQYLGRWREAVAFQHSVPKTSTSHRMATVAVTRAWNSSRKAFAEWAHMVWTIHEVYVRVCACVCLCLVSRVCVCVTVWPCACVAVRGLLCLLMCPAASPGSRRC